MTKGFLLITQTLTIVLTVIMISAGTAHAFEPNSNEVILYEHKDFQGMSLRYSVGTDIPNLKNVKMGTTNWNDKISSIKVGANVKLIVWEHKDYKGKCLAFLGSNAGGSGNYRRLSDWNFNDKITSLKVLDKENTDVACQ